MPKSEYWEFWIGSWHFTIDEQLIHMQLFSESVTTMPRETIDGFIEKYNKLKESENAEK